MILNAEKRYALVTGGSSGMGLEYVKQLAFMGYNLIVVALFQDETDAACAPIRAEYPHLDILSIGRDLSREESARELYDMVSLLRPDAQIEVLINNAGVLYPIHFRNMTDTQIGRIIMIHNYSLSMMCHYFSKQMLERGSGYILNVSSLAAWFPYPFISTYSATKAFTKVLTRALRTEYKGSGVRFSTVYFGAVSTNLYNLSQRWRKIALMTGIMITPRKAAEKALKMMFRGRSGCTPGLINKIAKGVAALLPHSLIHIIDTKVTEKWNFK